VSGLISFSITAVRVFSLMLEFRNFDRFKSVLTLDESTLRCDTLEISLLFLFSSRGEINALLGDRASLVSGYYSHSNLY
jgi:hypothetical protein